MSPSGQQRATPTGSAPTPALEQLTPIAFDWDAPHAAGDVTAAGGTMLVLPPAARHPLPATTRLLDSAVASGVQHVVFLSTLGADFVPGFAFGRWALAGEQAVAAAGLPYTVLRPNSYMTNFLTMSRPGRDGALRLPWSDGSLLLRRSPRRRRGRGPGAARTARP